MNVGDIAIGEEAIITFEAMINSTAYGATIDNTAVAEGSNTDKDYEASDDGLAVDKGESVPTVVKTASVSEAVVGDTFTYSIEVGNNETATRPWEEVVLTDRLPEHLSLVDGSVYIDGVSATYTWLDGVLSVNLGDLAAGETKTVTFKVTIASDAYGVFIVNVAEATGSNTDDTYIAPDSGVQVAKGDPKPTVTKSANVSDANVGDMVKYSIVVSNASDATWAWEDVVITDNIPSYLSFVHGSVYVNNDSAPYTYIDGVLIVNLGDVAIGETVTVNFYAFVNSTAYGETIYNAAVGEGSNTEDEYPATDDGVKVEDGTILPYVNKYVSTDTAAVGDTLTYTVDLGNLPAATWPWRDVVLTDVLPEHVSFVHGSVYINNTAVAYSYDRCGDKFV